MTLKGHFQVTKVKVARIVNGLLLGPGSIDKYVHHCPINKSTTLTLTSVDLKGVFPVTKVKVGAISNLNGCS